jgi:hypothetical protein
MTDRDMAWRAFDGGNSLGKHGSEDGKIIRDEELIDGARITLEGGGQTAPFAITCGIYGWMVHTRFFNSESEAQLQFGSMKDAIVEILRRIPLATDPEAESQFSTASESINEFINRFP